MVSEVEPGTMLFEAAQGSKAAQRGMVEHSLELANSGRFPVLEGLYYADCWARIAAAYRPEAEDFGRRLSILALIIDQLKGDEHEESRNAALGECIALADRIADLPGQDGLLADLGLEQLIAGSSPIHLVIAKSLQTEGVV